MSTAKIIYTKTDEAPALATQSLLPILRAFTKSSGIEFELKDISLAGRILANFPECLTEEQRIPDALTELGELAKMPEANIIKLPNISASIPQLVAAIEELQANGFAVPDFSEEPQTDAEKDVRARYAKVLGSAVNPVLREGNSDRRVAAPVKAYAQKNPHSMGAWSADSKSHVAHMDGGDFYGSEQSHVMAAAGAVRIELEGDGETTVLKDGLALLEGEVIDAGVMSAKALREFMAREVAEAREQGVLFSLHMKATMMKVSDPIIFGHCVSVFFAPVLEKHAAALESIGFEPNNGIGDLYAKLDELPADQQAAIKAGHRHAVRRAAGVGDGRFRSRHHQSARAERYHHRCLDARNDPHLWPHVGAGRPAVRYQGGDPRSQLRRLVSRDDRFLQGQRRVRCHHDG